MPFTFLHVTFVLLKANPSSKNNMFKIVINIGVAGNTFDLCL